MKRRILISAILIGAIFCTSGITAFATTYKPFWVNTQSINLTLKFSGGKANASAVVKGYSDTSKISAVFTLKQKNANGTYTNVHTWPTENVTGRTLSFSGSASATAGRSYRLYCSAMATN